MYWFTTKDRSREKIVSRLFDKDNYINVNKNHLVNAKVIVTFVISLYCFKVWCTSGPHSSGVIVLEGPL